MGLVDGDGEAAVPGSVANVVENERKLLDRRDDDLLSTLDELAQVARAVGMSNGGPDLGELLDCVADLVVQDDPIRHHDGRIEDRRAITQQADELMGKPYDRVRLSRSGRVL